MSNIQYQIKTDPTEAFLSAVPQFESAWHYPWSEPVRIKPGVRAHLHPFETQGTDFIPHPQNLLEGWYAWLSEPKRFKPLLITSDQPFFFNEPQPPVFDTVNWFKWFSEPVRFKQGLSTQLQQFLAYHPRLLPKPNVTATLLTKEIDADSAILAVNLIISPDTSVVSATVSIAEVLGGNSGISVVEQ